MQFWLAAGANGGGGEAGGLHSLPLLSYRHHDRHQPILPPP